MENTLSRWNRFRKGKAGGEAAGLAFPEFLVSVL